MGRYVFCVTWVRNIITFAKYKHHGKEVFVRQDLKGRHRDFCLCGQCANFDIREREKNCPIANALYAFDVLNDLVTPVWECPGFVEDGLVID